MLQGIIALNYPDYYPQRWQGMLLIWSCVFVAVFLNTVVSGILPKIEGVILTFNVIGFFAILIPLVYLAPAHGSASEVFTIFFDEGGWGSQGLSFWLGVSTTVFAFLGREAAILADSTGS